MNEKQKAAIKAHMKALTEAFPPSSIHSFFTSLELANVINHDEKQVIRSNVTSTQMLIDLFKLLQQKDNAWSTIITQLIQNDQSVLAETLRVTADEVVSPSINYLNTIDCRHSSTTIMLPHRR